MNWRVLTAVFMALAQPAAADTVLKLSETAHVSVHPDELVASLRAEVIAGTASEAQGKVNALIGHALDLARQTPGIRASTGGYRVYQETKPVQWHAQQSIQLKSTDGAVLLKLTGTLQGQNLQVEELSWQVSPAAAGGAESEATKTALRALRARVDDAAAILGLRFASFREVRLNGTQRGPVPMLRAMPMAAAAAPAPPPVAEAQDADIAATVDADAVLVPAQP